MMIYSSRTYILAINVLDPWPSLSPEEKNHDHQAYPYDQLRSVDDQPENLQLRLKDDG